MGLRALAVACALGLARAHTEPVQSIDAGADTVTLQNADPGITVGTQVSLASAAGQTCASAVATPLTVTGVDGAVVSVAAAGQSYITASDDAASTNCVLIRAVSPAPGAVPADGIFFTKVDEGSFQINWKAPTNLGDYNAEILGYDVQIAEVCELSDTEQLVYANQVATHLRSFDLQVANVAMTALNPDHSDAYAAAIVSGGTVTDAHGVNAGALSTGDEMLSRSGAAGGGGNREIGAWGDGTGTAGGTAGAYRELGPWGQTRRVSYMEHTTIPGAHSGTGNLATAISQYGAATSHGIYENVVTEGCTSTLVAAPNTVTEEDATLCVLTSGSPGSCAPDPTANAGSSVATCAYVPAAENVYTRGDCDGDGFADHLCVDAVTNERGTLLSGSGCTDNWPSAAASECAALPAAGYATLAHLASDEGSALGAAQAGTVAGCTFLCDADSSCESFNYDTVDSECTLMDKATTASDDVVDDATAAGHVTYYKQPLCVAAVATVPNVDLEATKIAETGVDAAGTTIDISLYLEHNAWTPDITLARKYFTVANVGLANEPVINTVMPYDVRAVMAGEDPAGVAAAKRVYGNMTLLAAVLNAAGAVVYDGSGVAQQIMQLTDVAAVSTATKGACPPGQWARDPWCYACTVCGPGFAKISDCGEFVDTVCEPCPHETYSNHGIECLPCTDPCLGGVQFEATKCTASTNRVCGTCAPGSVGVRLCDHKSLTRAQPNTISPGSPFYQPEFAEQGKFECPWTCIGNNKPKLSRNSQKMSANWASDHLIPTSNASPNYVPRTRIGGVEAWVCKGREAQGQMMYGVRSAGRVCAPQKSVSVNQQTFASVATVDASLANDGNQVRTCVCVESSPVAWWGTQLKRAAVDPTLYIYASGDCCANSVPDEAAEPMTVYIGASSDFSAATQCGSFDPAGRAGYVVGNIECSGSGSYIFVSAPNKLSLVEVKVYTLNDLDVGIGHPREFVPRSERDAQTRVRTAAEVAAGREGAVLESDGGAWIDRSPNGISTRIGNFALGITPHRPFYSRFGDEFQQTGEQHVTQDSYLVGDEY